MPSLKRFGNPAFYLECFKSITKRLDNRTARLSLDTAACGPESGSGGGIFPEMPRFSRIAKCKATCDTEKLPRFFEEVQGFLGKRKASDTPLGLA